MMGYYVVLRLSDWECYAGWASFRMNTLLEEFGIKFRKWHVKPRNAPPEIYITTPSGKEKRFCEGDLEPGNGNYKNLISLLSKIWAEQNTSK